MKVLFFTLPFEDWIFSALECTGCVLFIVKWWVRAISQLLKKFVFVTLSPNGQRMRCIILVVFIFFFYFYFHFSSLSMEKCSQSMREQLSALIWFIFRVRVRTMNFQFSLACIRSIDALRLSPYAQKKRLCVRSSHIFELNFSS